MPENFAWSDKNGKDGSGPRFESPWGKGNDGAPPAPQPLPKKDKQDRTPETLPERQRERPPFDPLPQLEIDRRDPPGSTTGGISWNLDVPDVEKQPLHTLRVPDYLFLAGMAGAATEVVKQVKPFFEAPVPKASLGTGTTFGALERSALAAERSAAKEAILLGEKGCGTRIAAAAGKGMLLAGGALATGLVIDSLLGNDADPKSPTRLLMDGLVLPGILVSSLAPREKLICGLGVFCGTRAAEYFWAKNKSPGSVETLIDRMAGDARKNQSTLNFSSLLVPNEVDALLLPAAVLGLPGKYKLAGAAGTYVVGRTVNAIRYHNNPKYEGLLVKPAR